MEGTVKPVTLHLMESVTRKVLRVAKNSLLNLGTRLATKGKWNSNPDLGPRTTSRINPQRGRDRDQALISGHNERIN